MEIFPHDASFDWIGKRRWFYLLSGALMAASILSVALGGIEFGTDFAGGYELQARFPKAVTAAEIEEVLKPLNIGDARVQTYGGAGSNEYLILVRVHGTISEEGKQKLQEELTVLAGG